MATRSTIWVANENGVYDGIYCHWDGYLEHNGEILKEHYTSEEKVRELIALGSISILAERIFPDDGEVHTFDNAANGVCVAYHRDRGEDLNIYHETKETIKTKFEEYNYLFEDGVWYVQSYLCETFITLDEYKALENAEDEI